MKIGHYTIIIYNMLKLSKYSERNENKFTIRNILISLMRDLNKLLLRFIKVQNQFCRLNTNTKIFYIPPITHIERLRLDV